MRAYRRLWWTAILAALLPAALLALLLSPVPTLVVTAAVLGLLAGAALVGSDVLSRLEPDLVAATALPVTVMPVLGFWTVPFLLGSLLSTPYVAAAVLGRIGADHVTPDQGLPIPLVVTDPDAPMDVTSFLGAMSGSELCAAWNASFVRVKSASSARERCLHAGIRGSLLDELERRDHETFAGWLGRSPSPAGQPWWVISTPPARPRQSRPRPSA